MADWNPEANDLFLRALEVTGSEDRKRFLDEACAAQPDLRARVEALLRAHDRAGEFLGRPVLEPTGAPGPAWDATRTGPARAEDDVPLDFLAPSDKPGSLGRLGNYEVEAVVGRGGMGVVFKAFDESLHRVVAVKVMAPLLATGATARQRFVREARAAAAVVHEHVVTIHAVDEAGGLPFIVMQYVAGTSLQDRLDRDGPLRLPEVLRIGAQAAAGLGAAHKQGLVHRDVKPANILLENGVERVKLTDFGLARAADDASLTQSGAVAGTPQYMSPEQAEGKPVDARSDLFSLGSVLYAICTGRPPFRAPSSMAVLKRVCEDTPTPVREVNPEVPEWLADVIARLHAKNPADRFQSAEEVADLLGRHLAHVQHPSVVSLPAAEKPVAPPGPAPRRGRWAVAAALLVLLVAGLGTTEATGVTRIRATVVRVFTPDGTLVVEADDPAVKVTVEGDGDLVIAGAGPHEVRLKPGSYKLHAVKDGKSVPLDRDLVTITRGDTQVVRVRVEGTPPSVPAPQAEAPALASRPFVILARGDRAELQADTLAEAIRLAWRDDTIEVRSNGPFYQHKPVIINNPVRIRAGEGFRPVFDARPPQGTPSEGYVYLGIIRGTAHLVLEGLEFRALDPPQKRGVVISPLVTSQGDPVHVTNCRFVGRGENGTYYPLLAIEKTAHCEVRNCQFIADVGAIRFESVTPGGAGAAPRLGVRNSVMLARANPLLVRSLPDSNVDLVLTRNTIVGTSLLLVDSLVDREVPKVLRIEASGNVADQGRATLYATLHERVGNPVEVLRQNIDWKGDQNLFAPGYPVAIQTLTGVEHPGIADLDRWRQFWNSPETGSVGGRPRYRGGNIVSYKPGTLFPEITIPWEQLTPELFRLRVDSPGHAAGRDGEDLGVDVGLVGPGPAYERWKKTPEYPQWLKDSGQQK
jgi:hypothetical protein